MTREIKFRAWSKYRKQVINLDGINFGKGQLAIWYNTTDGDTVDSLPLEDLELMQFTGLLDKNGKEIYEGDIVLVDWNDSRYEPHNVEVKWSDKELGWEIEGGCLTTDNHHFEVAGNKFENPELLD